MRLPELPFRELVLVLLVVGLAAWGARSCRELVEVDAQGETFADLYGICPQCDQSRRTHDGGICPLPGRDQLKQAGRGGG